MTSLLRACITCGTPTPSSRCPAHSRIPTNPARRRYQSLHGYQHQVLRRRMLKAHPYCAWVVKGGCRGALTLDYIQPLSLGGAAPEENAQILCMRHNVAKGGRNRLT